MRDVASEKWNDNFKMLIVKRGQIGLNIMNKCNEQAGRGDTQITAIVRDWCR